MIAATGSNQKLKLFMRANAMSDAPICIGIIQFAKPTNAGMMAPNTMMMPCMVVNWFGAQQQGERAAFQQHGKREDEIHRPDVFMVRGE
ncbi:hypothetical protein G6F68_016350 [Rhizopus microsporus]|nr:hypothetical protein G6F68_016350 [Rhizopus microsporus]